MEGTFKGISVAEAAAPLALPSVEAFVTDFYDKPENPPDPVTGDPTGELKEANDVGNSKIQLPNGRWIKIIQLFPEDDEEYSLFAFMDLWADASATKD